MAQNEMRAEPALPERVRSMEGLGVCAVDRLDILVCELLTEPAHTVEDKCSCFFDERRADEYDSSVN